MKEISRERQDNGRVRRERGSTTVLVVAMLPVVLLLMGLSIDAGRIMAAKSELYKASDVAARKIAEEIDMREASETGQKASVATDDDAREWVEKNLDGLSGGRLLDVNVVNNEAFVEVDSCAEIPLLFSGLISRRSTVVEVSSIGRLKPYTAGS
jgi:hypothetical protein